MPEMLEAYCEGCGETFVPADKDDLIHAMTEAGENCGGQGILTRQYYYQP